MEWNKLSNILFDFYSQNGKEKYFNNNEKYLSNAFKEIEKIWLENFNKITNVNYVMLSEAPLWGRGKKYIYNPKIKHSQFFYHNDLGCCINEKIDNKIDLINKLNELGIIILDISPFALNKKDTAINYNELSIKKYKILLTKVLPIYFKYKLELISEKKSKNLKIFFRYCRIENAFKDVISKIILDNRLIKSEDDIQNISQKGGGINRKKLGMIINAVKNQ